MHTIFRTSLLIALVALFIGLGIAAQHFLNQARPPEVKGGTILPVARALPAFSLLSESGEAFQNQNFKGHWSVVFAGFTFCPAVCPATLALLKDAFAGLDEQQVGKIQMVFVSVDPERDTPERLKQYLRHFNPKFKGLTGTEQNLNSLLQGLGLVYLREPDTDEKAGTIDHSTHLAIIDPQGNLAGYLTPPYTVDGLKADLKALVKEGFFGL